MDVAHKTRHPGSEELPQVRDYGTDGGAPYHDVVDTPGARVCHPTDNRMPSLSVR
ncbi:hypothetical protein KIPE111705_02290 [Kibdelosporangium persicum]